MTAVQWIESLGVRVMAEGQSHIALEGLASLGPEVASDVLAFARKHKQALLGEMNGDAVLWVRRCRGCGVAFVPTDERKIYCSASCFSRLHAVLQ